MGWGQNPSDCSGAIVICDDTDVDVPDSPGEVFDFNNPNNDIGCHETGETSSVWLYFRFRQDMPAGSDLTFTIDPFEGGTVDYDFAVYPAENGCGNLGSPLRCSYTWAISNQTYNCGFCPLTGLGMGEVDASEGIFFDENLNQANGFVAPMIVEPGQGFYVYINEFYGNSNGASASEGFNISFGGVAADYFDCTANPNCDLQVVALGNDTTLCGGDIPLFLDSEVTFSTGFEQYSWTGEGGAGSFLSDPSAPRPEVLLPDGFSGVLTYYLEVASDDCINRDTITLDIESTPPILVSREAAFCEGSQLLLDAGPGFATYNWSTSAQTPAITVDSGGVYSVTVTAPGNGCTIIRDIMVTEEPEPQPAILGGPYLCEGTTDTLFGGAGFASYDWGQGTADSFLLISQPGLYTLSVVSEAGCAGSSSILVEEIPAVVPDILAPAGICPDGAATLSAGQQWAAYAWSNGSADSILVVDTAGLYTLTVADTFGCTYQASVNLQELPLPQPEVSGDTVFCAGGAAQLLTVQAYEGYQWSTGDTTATTEVTAGGLYYVTVTDQNGCRASDSLDVIAYDPLEVGLVLSGGGPFCEGQTVGISVAQPFEAYAWSTGDTLAAINVTMGGLYQVTVTDDRGCTGIDSLEVVALVPPSPQIAGPAGLCPGTDGVLEVGSFPLILWGDGSIADTLEIDGPGLYTVEVGDQQGCVGTDTLEVLAYDAPQPLITGDTSLCDGSTLTFGLDQPYEAYAWSDGSTADTLLVPAAGLYAVTVTNMEGCTASDTVVVAAFPNPALDLPAEARFCAGDSIQLDAGPGYATYSWSDGSAGPMAVVRTAGLYRLTVTNAFGCPASDSIEVVEEALPQTGLDEAQFFCAGDSLLLQALSGQAGYTWSTGDTTAEVWVSEPGLYWLEVEGLNGCIFRDSLLSEEQALPEPAILGDSLLCEGETALLSLGAPYTAYDWGVLGSGPTAVITSGGTYPVLVTDSVGCQGVDTLSVIQVPLPALDLPAEAAYCENGSAVLSAGNGLGAYEWSTGSPNFFISVSMEGTYSLTVTDANGCTAADSTLVIENPSPDIQLVGEPQFCEGGSTVLSVADTSFQIVAWSTGMTGQSAVFTMGGQYLVSVLDTNNCSAELPFSISSLSLPEPAVVGPAVACEGDSALLTAAPGMDRYLWSTGDTTQSIWVEATGLYVVEVLDSQGCSNFQEVPFQIAPYPELGLPDTLEYCEDYAALLSADSTEGNTYDWSTGDTTHTIIVDAQGIYSLTLTNSAGCSTAGQTVAVELPEPTPLVDADLSLCPGDTNVLALSTPYVEYFWSTGEQTPTIGVSEAGAYQVTVTDSRGCQSATNIVVQAVPGTSAEIVEPSIFCEGDTVFLSLTEAYASYLWSDGTQNDSLLITGSGTYEVTVANLFGCTAEDEVFVSAFAAPDPGLPPYQSDCAGTTFAIAALPGFESYSWSTGSEALSISVTQTGIYELTVTDGNGCRGVDTAEIFAKPPPAPQLSSAQNICRGSSAVLSVNGTFSEILWTTGATTDSIVVDEAGGYGVTVRDSLGCAGSAVTAVFVFDVPAPDIAGEVGFCPGGQAVFGVAAEYASYAWSHGPATAEVVVDSAGIYEVTVRDTLGCMNTAQWEVQAFAAPELEITGPAYVCPGDTIALLASHDAAAITWSTGDTLNTIGVSTSGEYWVEAQSEEACVSRDTFVVAPAFDPLPESGPDRFLDCDTRSVVIGSEGAPQPTWVYSWSGPGITPENAGLANPEVAETGSYTLIVQNTETGCVSLPIELEVGDNSYSPGLSLSLIDTLDCNTPTVQLSGSPSGAPAENFVFSWSGPGGAVLEGETGPLLLAGEPGLYTLRATDTLTGCGQTESAIVIGDFEIPTVVINPNVAALTCADTLTGITAVAYATYGPPTLEWTGPEGLLPGETELQLEVDAPGLYTLTATDPVNGCQASDSVLVRQDTLAPIAVLVQPDELGCLAEKVLIDGRASSQGAAFAYTWTGPAELDDAQLLQEVGEPGLYRLLVRNMENGCTAEAAVWIVMAEGELSGLALSGVGPRCAGESNGLLQVDSVFGGIGPYLFSLNDAAFAPQQAFGGLPAGQYDVAVQDAEGCETAARLVLASGSDPQLRLGEDREISLGDAVLLNAQTNLAEGEWSGIVWSPADSLACDQCLSWTDYPLESTLYTAVITDTLGCTATDQMLVRVRKDRSIYFPNVFSPNADGANDLYMIFSGPDVVEVRNFEIYDRWGEQMFRAQGFQPNDPSFGWDGTFRGRTLNMAHFVYQAEVEFVDGEVILFKGGFDLVR